MDAVEVVSSGGEQIAIIIRASFFREGITFFTPPEYSQQLAYMRRPAGHQVAPHRHNPVPRQVTLTQEVLFVRSGRVRLDLYNDTGMAIATVELVSGDTALLATGGHGLTMLETTEIIEVKQGPYVGDQDKSPLLVKGTDQT